MMLIIHWGEKFGFFKRNWNRVYVDIDEEDAAWSNYVFLGIIIHTEGSILHAVIFLNLVAFYSDM